MAEPTTGGTGGCLCGAVRYRYRGEPSAVGLCQCQRCQRQSGSAFLIGVVFPREAVTIEGRLTTYETGCEWPASAPSLLPRLWLGGVDNSRQISSDSFDDGRNAR
jgi:hypothetical protein